MREPRVNVVPKLHASIALSATAGLSSKDHEYPRSKAKQQNKPQCHICKKIYTRQSTLNEHLKSCGKKERVLLTYGGLVNAWLKRGQREVNQWSNTGFVHRLDTLYPCPLFSHPLTMLCPLSDQLLVHILGSTSDHPLLGQTRVKGGTD